MFALRLIVSGLLVSVAACADATAPSPYVPLDREQAGGATTVIDLTSHAFSQPAVNLAGSHLDLHLAGDVAFGDQFVRAPAPVNQGLGPLFNDTSCEGCHVGDGRARDGFLMRLSSPGAGPLGGPLPVDGFGGQLQDDAIFGIEREGRIDTQWVDTVAVLGDGTQVVLRRPVRTAVDAYAPLDAGLLTSVRMPRPVFGLGLLEAVDEAVLFALADESDLDQDGISGRVNQVFDVTEGRLRVGRFGWKANQPSLLQQVAAAYLDDMGVTSSVFPVEASAGQLQDDAQPDDPEVGQPTLEAAVFYVQTLAVPAPRDLEDPVVVEGERLFSSVGCGGCHVPRLETRTLAGVPEVSGQVIYPFTDLLLHDMGPALADGRPDWQASGSEWRTPPLWGLGLGQRVSGHNDLLHDGRARDALEAVLWHGGEASSARQAFSALPMAQRRSLLAFLESL